MTTYPEYLSPLGFRIKPGDAVVCANAVSSYEIKQGQTYHVQEIVKYSTFGFRLREIEIRSFKAERFVPVGWTGPAPAVPAGMLTLGNPEPKELKISKVPPDAPERFGLLPKGDHIDKMFCIPFNPKGSATSKDAEGAEKQKEISRRYMEALAAADRWAKRRHWGDLGACQTCGAVVGVRAEYTNANSINIVAVCSKTYNHTDRQLPRRLVSHLEPAQFRRS